MTGCPAAPKDDPVPGREPPPLVFLVGMPRSGTKLLRDLLNKHPDVAIFPHESHFIPAFHRRFGARRDLDDQRTFRRFHEAFRSTAFCRRLALRGIEIAEADWRSRMQGGGFADLLRAMFDCYRIRSGASIVGDKTPEYITQVPLLANLLPEALFVHIVRDPRDHVLSMRNAWGKNTRRAAYRWKVHVRKYCDDIASTSARQITVRYEDLLADPAQSLSQVCGFLGIGFQPQMTSLDVASEELGDARGVNTLLAVNSGKWIGRLGHAELRAIDSLAGLVMTKFGYQPVSAPGDGNLGALKSLLYRSADAISLVRYRRRTEGSIAAALRESWRAYRHSGADE